MKLSLLRSGLLCGVFLALAITVSRADDFQWDQQSGPPASLPDYACVQSPACASTNCTAVDPPKSVVPDGGTNSVVVKSYYAMENFVYGTCQGTSEGDNCTAYPNVKCARLQIFGMEGCKTGDLWGTKVVYSGNCSK